MTELAQNTSQQQAVLSIQGHKLAALLFNQDKDTTPVIFIHGITSSTHFWTAAQTPFVRDHLKWYSLSLPGHYPATFPGGFTPANLTADHLADVMLEAINKLVGDQPFIVLGHSTGGFSALNIARYAPQRVKGVGSIAGFPHGKWTGILGLFQQYARWGAFGKFLFNTSLKLTGSSRAVYKQALRFYATDHAALYAHPDLETTINKTYPDAVQLDLAAMWIWFNRMPHVDITDELHKITAPTIAIVGNSDPIVPPSQARVIVEQVPNAILKDYDGCGHLPPSERRDPYNQDLTEWLKEVLSQ